MPVSNLTTYAVLNSLANIQASLKASPLNLALAVILP